MRHDGPPGKGRRVASMVRGVIGKGDMQNVETWPLQEMTAEQRRAIATLLCGVWPKPGRTVETRVAAMEAMAKAYDGPAATAPRSFVILDDGTLAAHAEIHARTILTTDGERLIAALARVCTEPSMRGRGYGEVIVRAAFEPVDQGQFELSLFQTTDEVQPFYEHLGARPVQNRFVNSLADDPEADPWWNPVKMIYPAATDWPEGTIDMQGRGY
ncbi:GNAT family N-acetyltransferase [Pirellulales bacterium]|nr:GNAT family N-acetyltransferase [Pirellulales bacterium]